jgi:hypothetical protein
MVHFVDRHLVYAESIDPVILSRLKVQQLLKSAGAIFLNHHVLAVDKDSPPCLVLRCLMA